MNAAPYEGARRPRRPKRTGFWEVSLSTRLGAVRGAFMIGIEGWSSAEINVPLGGQLL
jgi:hypothetical protein